jgi:hypothetical protein
MTGTRKQQLAYFAALAAVAAVVAIGAAPPALAASKLEERCVLKASKAAIKFASTHIGEMTDCAVDAAAEFGVTCPTVKNATKISKARIKLVDAVEKDCQSACSISRSISCVANHLCPARDKGTENCTAGGNNKPFDMGNLGFPGPYCEEQLGHPVESAVDIAECMSGLAEGVGSVAVSGIFGNVSPGVSKEGLRCLSAASKGLRKLSVTVAKSASKCRNGILRGKKQANPVTCVSDDAKLTAKVVKAAIKMNKLLTARCTDESILELDLCGNGVGGTATLEDAQSCLQDLAKEIGDSEAVPAARLYSDVSLIDAIYPPKPVCGDNLVNQLPNGFLPLGEECDGFSDSACPGLCAPPGDLFECTCLDVPRMRFFAKSDGSETDAGWTGRSHNQVTSESSGFVLELSGCDCDSFDGVNCIGSTGDSVCDLYGATQPSCSFDFNSGVRCDEYGTDDDDGNGMPFGEGEDDEDEDCFVCDAFSENHMDSCTDDGDCLSRCFDAQGLPQGACGAQSDCAAGQVCRGRCDTGQRCIRTLNGPPLPVVNGSSPVCTVQKFRSDVTGTMDLQSGNHEIYYRLFSQIHFASNENRPCPVCGGFCVGGGKDLDPCMGRCSQSETACMVDADCDIPQTCNRSTPDCPGGECELSRVCGADPTINPGLTGAACRVTHEHDFFGSLSTDCLPASEVNVSGRGLEIDYLPWTSGTVSLGSSVPCTASGFELIDCPCPAGQGGEATKPNKCTPACNAAGPDFGVGCADGNSVGEGTGCAGGVNQGKLCDEDADCPDSSCSANPMHCIGDPAFDRFGCDSDADCGLGSCVDACPGGRCLPLCVPTAADPFDGEGAAGPSDYHCSGGKFQFKSCPPSAASGSCDAVCSVSGISCVSSSQCPAGETCEGSCEQARDCEAGSDGMLGTADDLAQSGVCVVDPVSCFLNPILGEGGTTDNGMGDATNMSTVGLFCSKPVPNNPAVNNGAGFGGPTRVRVRGENIPNFTSIP